MVEKLVLFHSKHLRGAVYDLFCAYYNFNVCYCKSLVPVLLFFQCFVFELDRSGLKKPPVPLQKFMKLIED